MGAIAALAIGGAVVGGASGFLSSQGAAQQAQAQYLANKIEVERNNFQNSLATDKKNFAAARQNAMRRWNNKKIAQAAVENFSDTKRYNRQQFQANIKNTAANQIALLASLDAKATGRNLRGGTANLLKNRAQQGFQEQRSQIFKQRFAADTAAEQQYQNMLDQRDLLGYSSADIYLPGSTGVAPGGQGLNMLAGILGGSFGGAAQGASIYSGFKA